MHKMDSEYLYRAIAPFMCAEDFISVLFTCAIARNHAFARDYAIVLGAWAMRCAPKPSAYAIIKYAARIDSPLARLRVPFDPYYNYDCVGIKNACVYGHEDLAKWFWKVALTRNRIGIMYVAEAAIKGAYFADKRALKDYFSEQCIGISDPRDVIRMRVSAYYGAAKGKRSLEWAKDCELKFPSLAILFEICRTVIARKNGYSCPCELSENAQIQVRLNLWRHWIKRNDIANIMKYMGEDCVMIAIREHTEYTLWKYARYDTLCAYVNVQNPGWYRRYPQALYVVCHEGALERVRAIFTALERYVDPERLQQIIETCLMHKQHNLAVTEFFVGYLARLPPLTDNQWSSLIVGMIQGTSVEELRCVLNHADSLGHHVHIIVNQPLTDYAQTNEMREYVAQHLISHVRQ